MNTSRRLFIKNISLTVGLLAGGGIKFLSSAETSALRKKVKFRFALASDGHYGQPGTAFDEHFSNMVTEINHFHKQYPLQCSIINGDIIHNEKELLSKSKLHLDKLAMPYHTIKGNHDMVSDEYWKEVWGTASNHTVVYNATTFIIANTSNEEGKYLSPDLVWLKEQLEQSQHQKNVFRVFIKLQAKWKNKYSDITAIFGVYWIVVCLILG